MLSWIKRRLKFGVLIIRRFAGVEISSFARSPYGPILVLRPKDVTNRVAIHGSYGNTVLNAVKTLKPGDVFVDIGANAGLWSMVAADCVAPSGCVVAFEPQPHLAEDFMANRRVNRASCVFLYQTAVGEDSGLTHIEQPNRNHSGVAYVSHKGGLLCPKLSGEQAIAIASGLLRTDSVIVVKIDIEGYEYRVLQSAVRSPDFGRIKTVVVECDNRLLGRYENTIAEIYNLMADHGLTPTIRNSPEMAEDSHYDEVFVRSATP